MDELTQEQIERIREHMGWLDTNSSTDSFEWAIHEAYRLGQQNAEELRRDALRYRYLQSRTDAGSCIGVWRETPEGKAIEGQWLADKELDAAIDAAMEPKP